MRPYLLMCTRGVNETKKMMTRETREEVVRCCLSLVSVARSHQVASRGTLSIRKERHTPADARNARSSLGRRVRTAQELQALLLLLLLLRSAHSTLHLPLQVL